MILDHPLGDEDLVEALVVGPNGSERGLHRSEKTVIMVFMKVKWFFKKLINKTLFLMVAKSFIHLFCFKMLWNQPLKWFL
jgi:hypothetical protein